MRGRAGEGGRGGKRGGGRGAGGGRGGGKGEKGGEGRLAILRAKIAVCSCRLWETTM